MGQIILPKRYHADFKHGLLPPNGSIKLDTSGLLGSTVTHAFLVGGRLRNVCGPQTVTVQGGGSLVGSQRGIVLQGSGSAQAGTVYLDLSQYTRLTLSFLLWWDSYANDYDMAMELQGSEGFFVSPNSGGGTQKFEAGVTSSSGIGAVEIARPSASAWHQFHICFDRTTSAASTTEIYVDGVVQSESMTGFGDPLDAFGSADLSILGRNNTSLFGAGKISNIVIRGGTILPAAAISEEARYPYAAFSPANDAAYFLPSAGGGGATITPTGLSSSAFGSFSVLAGDRTITFTGKASDEAFGAFTLKARNRIAFTGKASDEAFGSFNVYPGQVFILPNPKTTDEAYGTHSLLSGQKLISPSGKATDEAFGSFIIISGDRILLINGKASDEAFGTHSINALTDTQNVYPSGYFDSAIGAFSLRPDQYIIFEGQEYLEFGQFLLSGSAVVRAMHFFDWVAQQPGLRGSLNDKLYQYLREHGFTGSTPTMLFLWLRSLGYAGNTATMLTSFERDYTTRWH